MLTRLEAQTRRSLHRQVQLHRHHVVVHLTQERRLLHAAARRGRSVVASVTSSPGIVGSTP